MYCDCDVRKKEDGATEPIWLYRRKRSLANSNSPYPEAPRLLTFLVEKNHIRGSNGHILNHLKKNGKKRTFFSFSTWRTLEENLVSKFEFSVPQSSSAAAIEN